MQKKSLVELFCWIETNTSFLLFFVYKSPNKHDKHIVRLNKNYCYVKEDFSWLYHVHNNGKGIIHTI